MKERNRALLLAVAAVAFVSACATVQSRWDAARSANTIEAYEDFLSKHPEGDLADQARVKRNELCEEMDWKDAKASHTAEAYRDFLKHHPRGKHKDDVHSRLEMLSLPKAEDLPPAGVETFLRFYRGGVFMEETLTIPENITWDQTATALSVPANDEFPNPPPEQAPVDEARLKQAKPAGVKPASNGEGSNIPKAVTPASGREGTNIPDTVKPVPGWGKIMYPIRKVNIRSARSMASRLKGQLQAGQPVKADFLENDWYAVFPVARKLRSEKMALGYVYAPLLTDKREPDSPGSADSGEKSAGDAPPKKIETENPSVDVRNLTFKVGEDGKELLIVEFDRFYAPEISKSEGEKPRIILKIKNTSPFRKDWAAIDTGGRLIRRIRSSRDPRTHEAVIVLDMLPEMNYFVNQKFYEKENMYSLEISGTE